jgi:hypothetical protein
MGRDGRQARPAAVAVVREEVGDEVGLAAAVAMDGVTP